MGTVPLGTVPIFFGWLAMILIIKHVSIEGPGLIGEVFSTSTRPERSRRPSLSIKICDLERGERLPSITIDLDLVISLGGPMNVYEENKYPFLKDEDIFIKRILEKRIPFLGICLGAQLLSKASGAKVQKADHKEIGFYKIKLEKEGIDDVFFTGLEKNIDVFQWHEDTFDIPKNGRLLATGELCKNQAFRVGENAYGLQFHLEVTGEMIGEWVSEYFESGNKTLEQKGRKMLDDYYKYKASLENNTVRICENLEKIINKKKGSGPTTR